MILDRTHRLNRCQDGARTAMRPPGPHGLCPEVRFRARGGAALSRRVPLIPGARRLPADGLRAARH